MRGLFGGTFDPVHFGHLNLAIGLKERMELAEVWVVPAAISPLRQKEGHAAAHHRLRMAELAFTQIPGFSVLDLEVQRGGPSYTIETLEALAQEAPELALLLGEDSLSHFMQWRRAEEILGTTALFVGRRPGPSSIPSGLQRGARVELLEIPQMEISATEIRERLKKGLYCGHLVPAKVLDYIYENQLYFAS